MRAWEPSATPPGVQGYTYLPTRLSSEMLEPWIENLRSLNVLKTPMIIPWESRPQRDAEQPEDYTDKEALHWRAERDVDIALWGTAEIYLDCGWDVSSRKQPDRFGRGDWVRRRMRYLQKVIRPLVSRISEEGSRYSEAHGGEDTQLPNHQLML